MLDVHSLSFTYPPLYAGESITSVLREITFSVAPGGALAVLGPNGSGKSTLCHVLAGLTPRYTGGGATGRVTVAGGDVLASPPPVGVVGALFQDAAAQLFNHNVEHEVAWGLEALGVPTAQIGPQVMAALERFGLAALRHRPPWALSGGQQKRLALATLWAMQPRVLLLDEPLGGLDLAGQQEVQEALTGLRQSGTGVLLTTLEASTAGYASQAALLNAGKLSPPFPSAALANQSELIEAGIAYPPYLWPDFGAAQFQPGPPALELVDLSFHYPGEQVALHNIDLTIPRGQFVALIGPNGAGKSTLIRHFNGLLRPTQGRVRLLGQDTAGRRVGELARSVSYLFQRPEQQFFAATVRDEVAYGPTQLRLPDARARVAAALARFALTPYAALPPAILSYGAQRAVALAALAALDTPVLALDEPTVGLDGRGRAQLLEWLVARRAAGVTLVVVTHEMALAARADRVIALDAGRIIADGAPEVILPHCGRGEAA
ncbi:MAG TPA: ABC transporter ATP-binding protein [Anaerolineae bacterium]|nr:ABC transporter ATP-binding protein [Anaerolineae bacterium]